MVLIKANTAMARYWYWFLAGIVFIYMVFIKRPLSKPERLIVDRLRLNLPAYGAFIRKIYIANIARTMILLLDAGEGIYKAIETTIPTVNNGILKQELVTINEKVLGGASFARALSESSQFPAYVINMIAVGEESGRLQDALDDIAALYETESGEALAIFTSLLEPIIIVVLSVVIGFVVVSMLLPIFQLSSFGG
jgi:type IV pilus assembly protein PilC